jgi:hypothetical protein
VVEVVHHSEPRHKNLRTEADLRRGGSSRRKADPPSLMRRQRRTPTVRVVGIYGAKKCRGGQKVVSGGWWGNAKKLSTIRGA